MFDWEYRSVKTNIDYELSNNLSVEWCQSGDIFTLTRTLLANWKDIKYAQ